MTSMKGGFYNPPNRPRSRTRDRSAAHFNEGGVLQPPERAFEPGGSVDGHTSMKGGFYNPPNRWRVMGTEVGKITSMKGGFYNPPEPAEQSGTSAEVLELQ